MAERILALCRAMGASEDQEELLLPLIQAAQERFAARLRLGVAPEDCGPAFPLACALAAMEGLEASTGSSQEVSSFTAGDLTIHRETGGKSKAVLSGQAEKWLAPWLADAGFHFQGVRG